MAELAGIDHLGLGSDYDGINRAVPVEDVSCLPRLADGLSSRGYRTRDRRSLAEIFASVKSASCRGERKIMRKVICICMHLFRWEIIPSGIAEAKRRGLVAVGITDHDTLELFQARRAGS